MYLACLIAALFLFDMIKKHLKASNGQQDVNIWPGEGDCVCMCLCVCWCVCACVEVTGGDRPAWRDFRHVALMCIYILDAQKRKAMRLR